MADRMCGVDDAIAYLRGLDDDRARDTAARLTYIRDKETGVKPKFHKGRYGHKYDYYTCGHCGSTFPHGAERFCSNCGYAVLWDIPWCLTGYKEAEDG